VGRWTGHEDVNCGVYQGPRNLQQNDVVNWFCVEVRSKYGKVVTYCRPFAATREKTFLTRTGIRSQEIF